VSADSKRRVSTRGSCAGPPDRYDPWVLLIPGDDLEPHPALVAVQPVTAADLMPSGLFPPVPWFTPVVPASR
jgi:hypothetical protein